jgi:uncharacterized protein
MHPSLTPYVVPATLVILSNIFMTIAWYGHLKFTTKPLALVILANWCKAFIEYCFAVPANRIGHQDYSTAELKTMQEVFTFIIFSLFSVLFFKESVTINHAIGYSPIALSPFFVFKAPL